MIGPSETARRTATLAQTIGTSEGEHRRMTERYERARQQKPRCTSCGSRVNYSKANDPYRLCESCQRARTDRILKGEERAPFDPDRARISRDDTQALPRLKEVREKKGWGLRTLARYSNVNKNTVQKVEDGGRCSEGIARKLGMALGVHVRELERSDT